MGRTIKFIVNLQITLVISKTKPEQGYFESSFIVLRGRPYAYLLVRPRPLSQENNVKFSSWDANSEECAWYGDRRS